MKKLNFTFFFFWSIVFLLITIIGFTPTFLLRPLYRETSLPLYLILHGVIMLFWFSGYFIQNLLIVKGQLANHKKIGIYWFMLAILMAVGNLNVVLNISNEIMTGTPAYFGEIRTIENSGGFVIGNLYFTLVSSFLILLAYIKRNAPNAHKRAIFGASFLLLTPAFDRFIRPFGLPEIFQYVGSFIIPISLLGYEILKYRKVHPMTFLVMAITFLMIPIIMAIVTNDFLINAIIKFLG
ncbi:hypothetical protein [Fulvivirga lutimaris]|uniref:hypothetical protein n=1 Tax=Fulvivirga lutimaris TaxID=1819566 RepID=UPI0012BC3873|nr:hypothetical protein [Fulvivirga lutimaris]MTI41146.1 hypothetical protein [Fulvivirga lutimaris]